jgi:hypothetical protein
MTETNGDKERFHLVDFFCTEPGNEYKYKKRKSRLSEYNSALHLCHVFNYFNLLTMHTTYHSVCDKWIC